MRARAHVRVRVCSSNGANAERLGAAAGARERTPPPASRPERAAQVRRRLVWPPRLLRHHRRPHAAGEGVRQVRAGRGSHSVLVRLCDHRVRHPGLCEARRPDHQVRTCPQAERGRTAVLSSPTEPPATRTSGSVHSDESVSFATLKGLLVSRAQIKYFKHNDVKDLERILKEVQAEDRKVCTRAARLCCVRLALRPTAAMPSRVRARGDHRLCAPMQSKKPVTRRFIVIEGLYQNYGDIAPLKEIVRARAVCGPALRRLFQGPADASLSYVAWFAPRAAAPAGRAQVPVQVPADCRRVALHGRPRQDRPRPHRARRRSGPSTTGLSKPRPARRRLTDPMASARACLAVTPGLRPRTSTPSPRALRTRSRRREASAPGPCRSLTTSACLGRGTATPRPCRRCSLPRASSRSTSSRPTQSGSTSSAATSRYSAPRLRRYQSWSARVRAPGNGVGRARLLADQRAALPSSCPRPRTRTWSSRAMRTRRSSTSG